jgi:hypothetical protein
MWDNLIPIAIFIIIMVVGAVRKAQESKQVGDRQQQSKRTSVEDLPEETRRMLFGDPRVPTAQRRGAAPTVQRTSEAEAPEVLVADPRPRQATPAHPVRQAPQRAERPIREATSRRQVAPPMRKPQAQAQRSARPQVQQRRSAPRQPAATQRTAQQRPPAQRRPQQTPQRSSQSRQQQAERSRQRQAAPAAAPTARAHPLFAGMGDVRRGILISEILGPPVSMK